jgi:hypothetical protein
MKLREQPLMILRGPEIVFLSAGGEDVARVYGRLGFEWVATAGVATA